MKGNGRQDGPVLSVDSIYGMFSAHESHKLFSLRCGRTDSGYGSCDMKRCSHTLGYGSCDMKRCSHTLISERSRKSFREFGLEYDYNVSYHKFPEGFSGPL